MGITIGELLATPHLRLRLHSGSGGLDREVVWTHTSDLPDPWQWLGGGELLMTNGMSFPKDAAGQARLVEELVRVGASALAIGEEMYCPSLTRRFTQTSDRLGLPILWIRYPMPFVAISRAVAEATLLEQSQRLMRTARIYDAIRSTTTDASESSRISVALARELRCPVQICDRESGQPFYPHDPPLDLGGEKGPDASGASGAANATGATGATGIDLAEAVQRAQRGVRIAGARSMALGHPSRELLVVDIPTHEDAVLAVIREGAAVLDGILLQHAATVTALELSQTRLALEHRRRAGAELMAQLLDGRLEPRGGRRHLQGFGLDPRDAVVVAATSPNETRVRELHIALWRNEIPHVVALRSGVAHAVVPDSVQALAAMTEALGESGRVGLSAPLHTAGRGQEAGRESMWALGLAGRTHAASARYGDATGWTGFGGIEDATALVDQHLAPLIQHDQQHQSELVSTLEAFLAHQRSWQKTAAALQVHRQTVLYRVRKIEQVTGRSLSETADIAELWMALQAQDMLAGRS